MNKLSANILRKLDYYVYLYSDPDTKEIFYIGKGKGSRIYDHLKDTKDSSKVRRIQEIKKRNHTEPIIEILVHGIIDDKTAQKIEASVIDLVGIKNLTNDKKGYESEAFGRMNLAQIRAKYSRKKAYIEEKVMLVKLVKTFRYNMDPMQLYDNTRGTWPMSPEAREQVQYVFPIYDGIIQETYKVVQWFEAGTTLNEYLLERFNPQITHNHIGKHYTEFANKWEFIGNICLDMRKKYLHKSVDHYWVKGATQNKKLTYIDPPIAVLKKSGKVF